jgi:hypothetical protein
MKAMTFKQLYALLALFMGVAVFGQQNTVKASLDSTKIKIGAQANLTLKATVGPKDRVNFPEGKNFGQLEVLESYPVDTVRNGALYELVKKYGLTQFDSGRYVVPSLPVVINKKIVKSDSLLLEVNNIKVDTLKHKLYDIKPITEAKSDYSIWYWILGIVLLAGAGFGAWWYLKNRKKPVKKEEEKLISPIEKATQQLQNLEKKEMLQRGEVKEYYSELADIARMYIEEAIHIPAMESTTGELIEAMRNATLRRKMALKPETFEQLERVLRNADMVKFAKSRPLEFEIAEDRNRIEKTIVVIDRSIPEEKDEDELHTQMWLEEQRKRKEKKRRRTIIWSSVGGVAVILLGFFIFFGVGIVKKALYGTSTKDLLEGQWVKSEYGFPGVTIETPEVMKRVDPATIMPKESMAVFQEMSIFMEGALFSDFSVAVSTLSYKKQTEVDLNQLSEGVIKVWESQGAKDILIKTEEFNTQQGITGLRVYGTMSYPHPVSKQIKRMYYEVFLFKQQQGVQQVTIGYTEGDEYAPQLLERVKNSIELRNLTQNQEQEKEQEQNQ